MNLTRITKRVILHLLFAVVDTGQRLLARHYGEWEPYYEKYSLEVDVEGNIFFKQFLKDTKDYFIWEISHMPIEPFNLDSHIGDQEARWLVSLRRVEDDPDFVADILDFHTRSCHFPAKDMIDQAERLYENEYRNKGE